MKIIFQAVSNEYSVNFGTKLYVDQDTSIVQRFGAIASHYYLADVENLNFDNSQQSAQIINKWIADVTKGHIKDLVSEDSVANSVVLLINALYFEGTWRFGFNKSLTAPFHGTDKKVDKSFMEQTGNFYYFNSKKLNAKILRLPYNGRKFSMFVILPNEGVALDSVVDRLDGNLLKDEIWYMDDSGTSKDGL